MAAHAPNHLGRLYLVQDQRAGGFAPAVKIGFAAEGDVVHQLPPELFLFKVSLQLFLGFPAELYVHPRHVDSIAESTETPIPLTPQALLALY
jgi:hypothetical protein